MRTLSTWTLVLVIALAFACGGTDTAPGRQGAAAPGDNTGTISGTVTLAGRSVGDHTGVMIFCAGTNQIAFTDADGKYLFTEMPYGTYDLHAKLDGFQQTALGQATLSPSVPLATMPPKVIAAVGMETMDLPLPADGGLAGVFTREGQEWAGDINVSIQGTSHAAVTDSMGRWMLRDLQPGQYVLAVTAQGFQPLSVNVEVLPDQLVDVPAGVLLPGGETASTGTGVIQGMVAIIGPNESLVEVIPDGVMLSLVETGAVTFPDAQGFFQFKNLPSQQHSIIARGPGLSFGQPVLVDLGEGEVTEVTVFLDQIESEETATTGGITGRLQMPDGQSAEGIAVSLPGTSHVTTADASGSFSFENIPAGPVTLMVRASGFDPVRRQGLRVDAGEVLDVGTIVLENAVNAPRVVETIPASGARDVLLQPKIPLIVRFSEPMDASTVRSSVHVVPEVPLRVLMNGDHPQASDTDAVILIEGLTDEIDFLDEVQVTIKNWAHSLEGAALADDEVVTFTIGRPGIYRSSPADGSNDHPHQRNISLYFNTVVEDQGLTERIRIRPEPPVVPNIWSEIDSETGWSVVRISGALMPDTDHHLEVESRLRTEGGSRLGNDREIDFKTAPELVLDEYGKPVERDTDYVVY